MSVKIGINGFGRIGRNFFRAALAKGSDLEIVAVNDLTDTKTLAHLLKYDSITGTPRRRPSRSTATASSSTARRSRCSPSATPPTCRGASWASTSSSSRPAASPSRRARAAHRRRRQEGRHLGSRDRNEDATFVIGVNERHYDPSNHHIISNASCTTNCLAPLAKVFNDKFGIERGLMTTVHAYTADQNLQDGPHSDLRRARAAALNIIPTSTGAAKAIGLVLPGARRQARRLRAARAGDHRLDHRPHARATKSAVTVDEIKAAYKEAAEGPLKGILKYTEDEIVSQRHRRRPALVDLRRRAHRVLGDQVKISAVVRQRVGLLQPSGRPHRVRRRAPVDGHRHDASHPRFARGACRQAGHRPLRSERPARQTARSRTTAASVRRFGTLNALIKRGAKVVVISHLGRPDGAPDAKYSLAPVRPAARGAARQAGDLRRRHRRRMRRTTPSHGLDDGDVALLENLRFNPDETAKDDADREEFAAKLADVRRRVRLRRLRRRAPQAGQRVRARRSCSRARPAR